MDLNYTQKRVLRNVECEIHFNLNQGNRFKYLSLKRLVIIITTIIGFF